MTTVFGFSVDRDHSMICADGQVTRGNLVSSLRTPKILRIHSSNSILALSGVLAMQSAVRQFVNSEEFRECPPLKPEAFAWRLRAFLKEHKWDFHAPSGGGAGSVDFGALWLGPGLIAEIGPDFSVEPFEHRWIAAANSTGGDHAIGAGMAFLAAQPASAWQVPEVLFQRAAQSVMSVCSQRDVYTGPYYQLAIFRHGQLVEGWQRWIRVPASE